MTVVLILAIAAVVLIIRQCFDELRATEMEEQLERQKAENKKLLVKLNDKQYVLEIKTIGY